MTLGISLAAHIAAAVACAAAAVALALGRAGERGGAGGVVRPRRLTLALAMGAAGLETLAAALRWAVTGHPPVFGAFENTMASVLALSIAAALMLRSGGSRPATRWDAAALLAFAPVTVAFGLLFSRAPYPLTISERSILVDVHVAFAWAAYALLLRACVTATRTLLGIHADGDADDRVMLRATGLGFTMFTGLMIVGAVYSFQLFTRFFSWEVVETLSVAAWLAYSVVLHQRLFFGWRGRRFAWLVLATLPLLLAAYWTWSVFAGTYHFFEITEIHA